MHNYTQAPTQLNPILDASSTKKDAGVTLDPTLNNATVSAAQTFILAISRIFRNHCGEFLSLH